MNITKNPFYKLQQAKKQYEAYKLQTTNPFLLAAKICAPMLFLGASLIGIGTLISLTIIGAVIGIPAALIGFFLLFSLPAYPLFVLLIWLSQEMHRYKQKRDKTPPQRP